MLLGRGIRPYIVFFKNFESEAGLKDGALNPSAVCWKPEEQGFKSMTWGHLDYKKPSLRFRIKGKKKELNLESKPVVYCQSN